MTAKKKKYVTGTTGTAFASRTGYVIPVNGTTGTVSARSTASACILSVTGTTPIMSNACARSTAGATETTKPRNCHSLALIDDGF